MSRLVRSVLEWRAIRAKVAPGQSVGFVPTMGALHAGHRSLLERSSFENDVSVLSIFVNPTQFDDPKDLRAYPKTLESDLELASEAGVDYVLAPEYSALYPDGYLYRVTESALSKTLCGAHRPGHFDGVLTVVLKLLQLVKADRAYFGEKDFQQFLLISRMAEAFFLDTEIVPCPIVRDDDGLALSSRNVRLSPELREKASHFPRVLTEAESASAAALELERLGLSVDYVEELEAGAGTRRLAAIRAGEVRLIDNVEV